MQNELIKERKKITEELIKYSFDLGKRLINKNVSHGEAVDLLVNAGMNKNSANDYLYYYLKLKSGEAFIRTTNLFATNYFLERIHNEDGEDGLRIALKSLSSHIEYYEKKANVIVRGRRNIHDKFMSKLK